MSGDVQPRKRKDKRRKKEGESLGNIHDVPGAKLRSLSTEEREDSPVRVDGPEHIHVHHDHGIGGNVFVKIIFFALLAVLLGLVGLIFIESRGSTDVDLPSIEESRFAEYFTGWLDDAPDDHGHDDHGAVSGEDDHEDHNDHEEEEDATPGDEGGDDEHSEADESEDVNGTEEEDGGNEHEDPDESQEQEVSESVAQDDDEIENEYENSEEQDDEAEEEENTAEEDTNDSEEASQVEVDNDNDDESEEVEESEENDSEDNYDLTQEDGSEEGSVQDSKDNNVDDERESEPAEEDDGSHEDDSDANPDDDDGEENEKSDAKSEENDDVVEVEVEREIVFEESDEGVEEIEESEEALKEEEEAVKKGKLSFLEDDEDFEDISDVKMRKKKEKELMRKLEKLLKEQEKKAQDVDENADDQGEEEIAETGGVALKLGVGVALVVVAHLVVVRRWRALTHAGQDTLVESTVGTDQEIEVNKAEEGVEPAVSRRQTLIPENSPKVNEDEEELDEEIDEEEYLEEIIESPIKRRTSVDVKRERQDPTKYYTKEELGDSEDLDDEEELDEEEEEIEEEEEEDFELEGSQTPSDLEEPEDEEEEEEEYEPVPPQRIPPVAPPRRGPQGVDELEITPADADETSAQEESLEDDGETGKDSAEGVDEPEPKLPEEDDDWLFRQELDFADEQFINNPQSALKAYGVVLTRVPNSLRALIGRARALDKMAEMQRSNAFLGQAIDAYQVVLTAHGHRLNDTTFRQLSARCVDRMRFAGRNLQAATLHQLIAARFPEEIEHHNAMAVSYLLAGRNAQARKVLEETLKKWPDDGYAQVHLGFILKTSGGLLAEGADLMEKGLRSNQTGTMDGRFLFHLGDSLHRLGRQEEAMVWYEVGVNEGIFKSKYQRSLYNVDRLRAQPWWRREETTYEDFFRSLERSWKLIREEGLRLLRAREAALFQDEAESLRDTGDWKQMDLFSRGRKQPGCTRAPITCQLISEFPSASTCARGQAKFSVMEPGTHVWPHCGPTNCRLRAHLGLVVPKGVFLRVAEETRSWEEGKVLIFDDSFEHEVWHNGTSVRLVLIVDVWHPELTMRERKTLSPI